MDDTQKLDQALADLDSVFLCLERTFSSINGASAPIEVCDVCSELNGDFKDRPVLETCARAHISANNSDQNPEGPSQELQSGNIQNGNTSEDA